MSVVAVEEQTVAKAKAKRPKAGKPAPRPEPAPELVRQPVVLTMRGRPEWKGWLKRLSKHCRLKVAVCVEQALMEYAQRRGFEESSPDRTT
jgi:hypothetical protein